MIQIFLHHQVLKITDKADNMRILFIRRKVLSDYLFQRENAAVSYSVVEEIFKEENDVNVIDKIKFSNKNDPIYQCFHVQLLYQDVKRENQRNQFVII